MAAARASGSGVARARRGRAQRARGQRLAHLAHQHRRALGVRASALGERYEGLEGARELLRIVRAERLARGDLERGELFLGRARREPELRQLRDAAVEGLALGADDLELPPLAGVGLAREQLLDHLGGRPGQEEIQPQPGEVAGHDLERAVLDPEQAVEDDDAAQDPAAAHGRARGHVSRRHERRVGLGRLGELDLERLEQLGDRVAGRVAHVDRVHLGLQRVEILHRELPLQGDLARAPHVAPQHGREVLRVGEGARHERHERDPVDEREQGVPRALEDLGEVTVAGHDGALDEAAHGARALLELALLQHVQRRAEQHVTPVEHLVEERMHRAEHALVGEVLGASGLHQGLEVDGADEVGLHGALGELPRVEAREPRALVEDAPQHRGRDLALGGARRAGEQHVLLGEEPERELPEQRLTLDEHVLQLAEERREVLARGGEARGLGKIQGHAHTSRRAVTPRSISSSSK